MNWILIGIFVLLTQKDYYPGRYLFGMASPSPLKMPGHTQKLSPYIQHWEIANFDRSTLEDAHQIHIEQKRHRRKRDLSSDEYGPTHTIKLNFFAHDKEFRLVLHQAPFSVFTPDVEIDSTSGPMDYDISRIYTGTLEDDDKSHVHAILTTDNLLDGTIETNSEQFYLEPSIRYSRELQKTGIHSIVYKLSDVKMQKSVSPTEMVSINSMEHCASEKLHRKILRNDFKRRRRTKSINTNTDINENSNNENNNNNNNNNNSNIDNSQIVNETANHKNTQDDVSISHNRRKRWLPDEVQLTDDHNPPLPLDLDVPYNDDFNIFDHNNNREINKTPGYGNNRPIVGSINININRSPNLQGVNIKSRNGGNSASGSDNIFSDTSGILRNNDPNYNNDGSNLNIANINNNNNNFNFKPNRNKNILVNNYNPNGDQNYNTNNNNNNNNNNNVNQRNSVTKYKNIIVNNFNNPSNSYNINNINNFNNNNSISNNNNRNRNDSVNDDSDMNSGYKSNIFNSNWTTMYNSGSSINNGGSSRPSHKTHVEIITKNGATKKPNIIVNNYNPDVVLTSQNFNSNLNLNIRNDLNEMHMQRAMYERKSTCMLYLQADHTFFQKMGSEEASIEAITRHVQRANAIYKNTDFNGDGRPDNITFMIKRIKVHNMNALKDPTYRFPGNYGVEKFLELFSEEDYDAFCLAYMFTYRDFEMGTLGLAWTGDLKNAGGVCEKNGHYRGSLKSLNTGIVTLLNYGKHVPPAVSHVTLAHEIGHNFGSPHDPEQCTPGGEDGNYIMFARATSGDKRNNNKFSPCSLKSIEPVLNAKARSSKGCFTEPQTSICGNGVVEPGEQCDCGWEEDCKDSCCFPMSRHPRLDEKPCTLTPRAMCSPSQGPCCMTDCKLKFGDKCRDDNGCRDPSFCDGRMPQCPPSVNKPNKTICNKEFVCYMGDCTGSICLAYGLESCQCLPGPNDPKTKSCELCCKQPGEGNACRSSFEWNEPPFDVPDMFAKPGTPCNDYNGYCDVFQKCREVDPSGPLATLRKLLLSEESIASFKKWMQTNWYTVVLAAIGVLVLLILSTKLLSKRSNLKLKSVTIIHSATTETVRLPEDNNGVIVHTAVRTKVPFKKKVRGERAKTNILNKNSANVHSSKGGYPLNAAKVMKRSNIKNENMKNRNKNRIAAPMATVVNASNDEFVVALSGQKKIKKTKKHKEIIDYSNNSRAAGPAAINGNHTNTFGKVQKWLLESPIVSQPLSHIEHSSKVRKVMSKSQSTPERLVQKSPQKTKSVGNLSNEKVKLQVVYKPPFKFSLKLSKNSAVKTHVIGGGLSKAKRKTRSGDKKRVAAAPGAGGESSNKLGERARRTALLLRTAADDEQLINVSSEPQYETLNPKSTDKPYYENLQFVGDKQINSINSEDSKKDSKPSTSKSSPHIASERISRSSSNANITPENRQPHSYSRNNSQNNPFAVKPSNSRKISDNSINLNRNFGSTQNLIQPSRSSGHLSKSKKRSSLNLKSSGQQQKQQQLHNQNELGRSAKRSTSNLNLHRENSTSNLRSGNLRDDPSIIQQSIKPPLKRSSSSTNHQQKRSSLNRGSFSNIPRASLSLTAVHPSHVSSQNHLPPLPIPTQIPTTTSTIMPQTSIPLTSASNVNASPPALIFTRQTSLNLSTTPNSSNLNNLSSCSINRPQTAISDDTQRHFDWPKSLATNNGNNFNNCNNTNSNNSYNSSNNSSSNSSNYNSNSSNNHHHQNHLRRASGNNESGNLNRHNNKDNELPSEREVMVSDIENLVS